MAGNGSSQEQEHGSDLPLSIDYFDYACRQHKMYDPTNATTRRCFGHTNHSYPDSVICHVVKERDELFRDLVTEKRAAREHIKYLNASLGVADHETEHVQNKLRRAHEEIEQLGQKVRELEWKNQSVRNMGKTLQSSRARPPRGPKGTKRPAAGRAGSPEKKKTAVMCYFCGKSNHTEAECWKRTGKCLRCGSTDHQLRHCFQLGQRSGTARPGARGPTGEAKVPKKPYRSEKSVNQVIRDGAGPSTGHAVGSGYQSDDRVYCEPENDLEEEPTEDLAKTLGGPL